MVLQCLDYENITKNYLLALERQAANVVLLLKLAEKRTITPEGLEKLEREGKEYISSLQREDHTGQYLRSVVEHNPEMFSGLYETEQTANGLEEIVSAVREKKEVRKEAVEKTIKYFRKARDSLHDYGLALEHSPI